MCCCWNGEGAGAAGPRFSVVGPGFALLVLVLVEGFVDVEVERPASWVSDGGGMLNWGGGALRRVSRVVWVAV